MKAGVLALILALALTSEATGQDPTLYRTIPPESDWGPRHPNYDSDRCAPWERRRLLDYCGRYADSPRCLFSVSELQQLMRDIERDIRAARLWHR